MTTFSNIVSTFCSKWTIKSSSEPTHSTDKQLSEVEKFYSVIFPVSYKLFIKAFETLSIHNLLESICENEVEITDIQTFTPPSSIIEETDSFEDISDQKGFIAFASDCMGNLFLFKIEDLKKALDDVPVYFFDHDFDTLEQEEISFQQFIERYNSIPN